ncbi:winged helix DNA-binding domain-containing protein [Pseudonocardia sp. WMMC193]|uniref:winged helix DNA-binding domain-containing protein n=1 Tax=Pseudonocardia sp. WMMC193 TaxID=2911965 RepID=UPI001F1D957F|nr:winged helix DNA-binding domain-containing protein [Pseudonocardia sp. WMMC193]MCF7551741.1 winged helix DNA-binding domain-containing protein [Pseudonocardia sp. WMMC193]
MTRLSARALNRAALARQFLLARADVSVAAAVAHLGGVQAQEPQEPFVGLWSRLRGFDPADLDRLLVAKELVRTVLMRRTVHLVTAADALAWRARHQALLRQRVYGAYRAELAGVDPEQVTAAVEELFADGVARTMPEIGRILAERWPDAGFRPLGELAVAAAVPMVQIPPRGLWKQAGGALTLPMATWLGARPTPLAADGDPVGEALVRRYLAAYGPAAPADLRSWCGLAGLPAAVAAVRPELVSFTDERGRELLDLPDAPRPDEDTPAPVRFLPAFDNAILGYDDRSRIVDDAHKGLSVAGDRAVLLDGRVAALWTVRPVRSLTLEVTPLRRFTRADRAEVGEEARTVADFLGATGVRILRSPA